jgi:hypothetical protein
MNSHDEKIDYLIGLIQALFIDSSLTFLYIFNRAGLVLQLRI